MRSYKASKTVMAANRQKATKFHKLMTTSYTKESPVDRRVVPKGEKTVGPVSLKKYSYFLYGLRHDKTNKMSVRPAKTQISLGICPVSSVFAVRMKKPWVLSYPMSAQRRLCQCHVLAHISVWPWHYDAGKHPPVVRLHIFAHFLCTRNRLNI